MDRNNAYPRSPSSRIIRDGIILKYYTWRFRDLRRFLSVDFYPVAASRRIDFFPLSLSLSFLFLFHRHTGPRAIKKRSPGGIEWFNVEYRSGIWRGNDFDSSSS